MFPQPRKNVALWLLSRDVRCLTNLYGSAEELFPCQAKSPAIADGAQVRCSVMRSKARIHRRVLFWGRLELRSPPSRLEAGGASPPLAPTSPRAGSRRPHLLVTHLLQIVPMLTF